ncbi:nuclear transport factor 2 family protein [Vibrio splendidus]|uniref:nuclear transport factor 2 family protein n=1 Tax=Vibrio splendidus TaxID=29497 RepID=UPI00246981BF|nr:nuclear transport factor 2 family protein [Vibrio splendidus]MDH5917607.1 hypothetical protein [Vibrio splendidus]
MTNIETIATNYFNALDARNFDRVAELVSFHLVLEDSTSPSGVISIQKGREKVIAYYQHRLSLLNYEVRITRSFASYDKVSFTLQLMAESQVSFLVMKLKK